MDKRIEDKNVDLNAIIDNQIDEIFVEAHGIVDTVSGDISPTQVMELEDIKVKLYTILSQQLEQNLRKKNMMTRVIESPRYGTFKFKNVMLDVNGTDLADGIDVYLDDEHIGEVYGHYDLEDYDGDKLVEIGITLHETI